jgi:cyclopropane fatty-acyl-phospholipid synthase-like methyltransferase
MGSTSFISRLLKSPKRLVVRRLGRKNFPGSAAYWEQRYVRAGNSGGGSYGRLAEFKAEVLNGIVEREQIQTVVELGCGDGAQLTLSRYPRYVGLDVSTAAIEQCRDRFGGDTHKQFLVYPDELGQVAPADLTLSLDVVYHLVEDDVFDRYMTDLFRLSREWVVIYASNVDRPRKAPHVRHRQFSNWIEQNVPGWVLAEHIPNRYPALNGVETATTSFAEFFVYRVATRSRAD